MNRGGVRIAFILAALTLAVLPAVAGQPAALCAAAKKPTQAEPLLAAAVAAAFGKATFKATADDCVYPLKVLHYATADVTHRPGRRARSSLPRLRSVALGLCAAAAR